MHITDPSDPIAILDDLFSPKALASYDTIATLVAEYEAKAATIDQICSFMSKELRSTMRYFIDGNGTKDSRQVGPGELFQREGAIAALDSEFWGRAMEKTGLLDLMPQQRRDDWGTAIRDRKCPRFEEKVVRDTFADLMACRVKFLAERVDGIFRGLSGEHVTNQPQGFGKRMIIAGVTGMYDFQKQGIINDLRCVIAKFMRRDEPAHSATSGLIRAIKGTYGEWVSVDGGALKIRLYMKGTAHLEVHPDMAWRLNTILHTMYPKAIAPQHRERPRRKGKDVALLQRLLPFEVIHALVGLEEATQYIATGDFRQPYQYKRIINSLTPSSRARDFGKAVDRQVEEVLESIGGVQMTYGWQFDYPPQPVLNRIIAHGSIPDEKAHQFYPTPEKIAQACVDLAQIGESDQCLEPQAGLGGLACKMPKDRTMCVEISKVRCDVLIGRGFNTICADFLQWATDNRFKQFDCIIMNPPFDQQRWRAHLEAAASLLAPKGRLVSVLPTGAKNKGQLLPGVHCEFPLHFENGFTGTGQDVVVLLATRD